MGEILKTLSVKPKKEEINDIVGDLYNDLKSKICFDESQKVINSEFGLQMFNEAITLESTFTYNGQNYTVELVKRTFKDENIIIETTLKTDVDSNSLNDDFYEIKTKLKEVQISFFKNIYWQKDTQNEKTCSELYGRIHTLENRFRELIVHFMVNKYGFSWTRNQISEDLSSKINLYSKWYRDNYTIFKNVKTELFNLQVNDLIELLKKAFDKKIISENDLLQYLKTEGGESDEIILQKVKEYKSGLIQQNIWEKDFEPVLGGQFNELWGKFNQMRNMVAHNKPICLDLYNDTISTIRDIDQIFDGVIEHFNKTFKSIEDIEVHELYLQLNEEFKDDEEFLYFQEAELEPTPDEEDVLNEITENEQIQYILEGSNQFISSFTGYTEEIIEFIEDIEQKLDYSNHSETKELLEDISNLFKRDIKEEDNTYIQDLNNATNDEDFEDIWDNLKSEIVDSFESLTDRVNSSVVQDEFFLETPLIEVKSSDSLYKIVSEGFISPEKGRKDELTINLVKDGVEVESGIITKEYGDYIVTEYGGAYATHGDKLWLELSAILNTYRSFLDKDLKKLEGIRDDFYRFI
ncbi:hypothetical protein [Cytobacillus oceanisediminis]|uniref:hypothetical protein n=1 Tax=Cytobacillus oceanisediminis TaxID=665099 RepID=UPI001C243AF0|nr:hypothetical protein [Cytobacillus oceanisediminis]MBU8769548.1 hypothetical protein [Cytobacillus oceanisediminis]